MNAKEAIAAICNGNLVECTKEEYQAEIRAALQQEAAHFIDNGDPERAQTMLEEVQRLDNLFSKNYWRN